ncbi:MAG TPA: sugar-transfer associated ATP-grasp domain-containing protein [Ignavibacteriaceae bacterium]|nr:sugar-transfer associated ATP-grasp domain-containing protein [Ignavibacteriaceae bacterium]
MIKKLIFYFLNSVYNVKLHFTNSRMINAKIVFLKNKKKLKLYPLDKFKPIVVNYPGFTKSDKLWLDFFYSIRGIAEEEYIPLTYYYNFIEPCLNDFSSISNIQDKNFYELYFKDIKTPKVILRRMNGIFYNSHYENINLNNKEISTLFRDYERIILKPSIESGSGKSILLFERINNELISEKEILNIEFLNRYGKDFVIQEFVKQHPFFKRFNPTSNNTLRVFTYRSIKDDSINILHILLRIGKSGSFLDHDNLGGVGISIKDSHLFDEFAYDGNGEKYSSINNINFKEAGKVPFIEETSTMAIKIAEKIFYSRLLAMDFTVDENGTVLLIEINCWGNGITQYQMNNGSLFNKFTKEILDYCYSVSQNKISVKFQVSLKK